MSNADTTPPYDEELIRSLGALVIEFSRLEAAAKSILATFSTPHQELGDIMVAGSQILATLTEIRTMNKSRLAPGELQDAIERWLDGAEKVRVARNRFVHGHWIAVPGMLLERKVRKSELRTDFAKVTAPEVIDLAERVWHLTDEALVLEVNLQDAGFRGITHVSLGAGDVIDQIPPSPSFQISPASPVLRRNPAAVWPGRAQLSAE